MKITGRNIKRRLYGLRTLPSNIKRARYFRGHGVHSPFVYAIVREVFMQSKLRSNNRELYEELLNAEVSKRRATQLQNLMEHCKYSTFKIDCMPQSSEVCDMVIATINTPHEELAVMADKAREQKITLCIMSPSLDQQRDKACKAIVDAHPCTSVDNRGYLLLFNNHLPKQIFRL
ncbi:MAG: hypothetical protein E7142_07775 [Rikenellaceae bacterium]|nr:hypothetical protein [Rikenellaceae bacterium]